MDVDEVAIQEFLQTAYPRLVAAVALVCRSHHAAEDAVQEALTRAWERSSRGEPIDELEAWVATVALNITRSALRRLRIDRRARASMWDEHASNDPTSTTDRAVDVRRALSALPRRQREAAVLRYYLQLDTRTAARLMGVSEGTVKSSLSRARTSLAHTLRIEDETEVIEHGRR
jgi:RNA polymerase sigma-70 factor (ECF subfamily)